MPDEAVAVVAPPLDVSLSWLPSELLLERPTPTMQPLVATTRLVRDASPLPARLRLLNIPVPCGENMPASKSELLEPVGPAADGTEKGAAEE